MMAKRPSSSPNVLMRLQEAVRALVPAKAGPLLLVTEVKPERISENACGPAFSGPARPAWTDTVMAR